MSACRRRRAIRDRPATTTAVPNADRVTAVAVLHEMAGPEMARIFAECRAEVARDDPERALRMLCVHRTGTVGVGEPSVFVGVASPHRDAAFAAARRLIDRLKERLPVWKKEVYADGHHWVGDRS